MNTYEMIMLAIVILICVLSTILVIPKVLDFYRMQLADKEIKQIQSADLRINAALRKRVLAERKEELQEIDAELKRRILAERQEEIEMEQRVTKQEKKHTDKMKFISEK